MSGLRTTRKKAIEPARGNGTIDDIVGEMQQAKLVELSHWLCKSMVPRYVISHLYLVLMVLVEVLYLPSFS